MLEVPSYLKGHEELFQDDPRAAALKWFRDAKYGLFLHYGLYSLLGRHEWVQLREKIPVAEYEKLQGQFGPVWRWHTAPGWHDYGDAVTMAYVGAAWGGIGTTGAAPAPKRRRKYVERRKPKVPISDDSLFTEHGE